MLDNAEGVADALMKNWFQKCFEGKICNLSYMMHRTLPLDDSEVTGTLGPLGFGQHLTLN